MANRWVSAWKSGQEDFFQKQQQQHQQDYANYYGDGQGGQYVGTNGYVSEQDTRGRKLTRDEDIDSHAQQNGVRQPPTPPRKTRNKHKKQHPTGTNDNTNKADGAESEGYEGDFAATASENEKKSSRPKKKKKKTHVA